MKVDLPPINPIIDVSNAIIKGTMAYVNIDDLMKNSIIDLYVDKTLFSFNKNFYRAILFHEFTHIYDNLKLCKNVKDIYKHIEIMSTYSEFHASQVEILTNLELPCVLPNVYKINMTDKLYYKHEYLNVEQYLLYPLADSTVILQKKPKSFKDLSSEEYNITYVKSKKSLMYYLGKYSICDLFAKPKPHNFFNEFGVFKLDALIFYKYLLLKDIDKILEQESKFRSHFFSYF